MHFIILYVLQKLRAADYWRISLILSDLIQLPKQFITAGSEVVVDKFSLVGRTHSWSSGRRVVSIRFREMIYVQKVRKLPCRYCCWYTYIHISIANNSDTCCYYLPAGAVCHHMSKGKRYCTQGIENRLITTMCYIISLYCLRNSKAVRRVHTSAKPNDMRLCIFTYIR